MKKNNLKNNIQKGISVLATGAVMLSTNACSNTEAKNADIDTPKLVSVMRDRDNNIYDYHYLVNTSKIFELYGKNCGGMEFFGIYNSIGFSTEFEERTGSIVWRPSNVAVARKILTQSHPLIIPDCFLHFWDNELYKNVDGEFILKNFGQDLDLHTIFSNTKCYFKEELLYNTDGLIGLRLVYSRMEFEEDFDRRDNIYSNNDKPIKKGDIIESYALYANDEYSVCNELIAFYQTGAGSECKNVQNAIVGDFASIIKPIENANLFDEPTTLSGEEYYILKRSLNNQLNHDGSNLNSKR